MAGLRPTPWWMLYELMSVARTEWLELTAGDRDKLRRLILKSRGQPGNLSPRERAEVKRILAKVDLKRVARQMVPKTVARRTRLGR